jgi:hypothetical protein
MKKSQTSNKVFTIQKLSDNGLDELITDLKNDIEHLEFVYTAKNLSGMCAKEDIEPYIRYRSYCVLLLDVVKNEQKNRIGK